MGGRVEKRGEVGAGPGAESIEFLTANAAVVTGDPFAGETGTFAQFRHYDGVDIEYVQWSDQLRNKILGAGTA
ncbi:MAG: Lactoylglutathione lyase-related lyase [Nocardia sp.]|nr:Lactoylglutathione lyase-related lyase [Nocardia sp.]